MKYAVNQPFKPHPVLTDTPLLVKWVMILTDTLQFNS